MERLAQGIRADVLICNARKIETRTYAGKQTVDVAKCSGRGPNLAHVRKFRDDVWRVK